MSREKPAPAVGWFCVEDCSKPLRPVVLLDGAGLEQCHEFIQRKREAGAADQLRVNYSLAMRRYLAATSSQAA